MDIFLVPLALREGEDAGVCSYSNKALHPPLKPLPEGRAKTPSADTVAEEGDRVRRPRRWTADYERWRRDDEPLCLPGSPDGAGGRRDDASGGRRTDCRRGNRCLNTL